MAPKGGKGGGGSSSSSGGSSGSSSSSCSSAAFDSAYPIAIIIINSITLVIFLTAMYIWSKQLKLNTTLKSLLAWWSYGLALLLSMISSILLIVANVGAECGSVRRSQQASYAIAIGVLWYYSQLILLGVIMITINNYIMNILGKRTWLFTVLHGCALGGLAIVLAALQGVIGYGLSGKSYTISIALVNNLGIAYHVLALLVSLYILALIAFWFRKLRGASSGKTLLLSTILLFILNEIIAVAYRAYLNYAGSGSVIGNIVLGALEAIVPGLAFLLIIFAAKNLANLSGNSSSLPNTQFNPVPEQQSFAANKVDDSPNMYGGYNNNQNTGFPQPQGPINNGGYAPVQNPAFPQNTAYAPPHAQGYPPPQGPQQGYPYQQPYGS